MQSPGLCHSYRCQECENVGGKGEGALTEVELKLMILG